MGDGAEIQYRAVPGQGEWCDEPRHLIWEEFAEYRKKPKPDDVYYVNCCLKLTSSYHLKTNQPPLRYDQGGQEINMKFSKTFCSQCGGEFGPRDSGFSHCADHKYAPRFSKLESLQNYTGNLLVAMVHLLDDADPKSPAAIKARQLLKEEIL